MKKKFRVFLCLLFAVIIPFSFVGCGDKTSGDDNDDSSTSTNPPSQPEQQETYVLDENEVVRILGESTGDVESLVTRLNDNSQMLEDSEYPSVLGSKTAVSLNYINYPKLVMEILQYKLNLKSKKFQLGKVYAYISGMGEYKYIEANVEGNNRIKLDVLSWDWNQKILSYQNFNFEIENGEINALDISVLQMCTGQSGKMIDFFDVELNLKDLTLNANFGKVTGYFEDSINYFDKYFTKEMFDKIPQNEWSYSYFEEIQLYGVANINYDIALANENIISNFDNFAFLNAVKKHNDYTKLVEESSEKIVILQDDIIGIIEMSGNTYRYDSDEYAFDKII